MVSAAASTIAVISAASSLVAVGLWWWGLRRGIDAYQSLVSDTVVGILFPMTGVVLLRRSIRGPAGWVLVSAGLVGVSALCHEFVRYSVGTGATGGLVAAAAWVAGFAFAPYWLQTTLLPLCFPPGRPMSRRLVIVIAMVFGVGTLAAAFRPDPDLEALGVPNPLGIGGSGLAPWFDAVLAVAAFGSLLLGAPISIGGLLVRARRATGVVRAQSQWLLLGFICAVVLIVPEAVSIGPVWLRDPLYAAGFAAIPAGLAVAVLRHRLWDIEVVVNRTVVYALLTVVGLGFYFGAVAVAGRVAPLVAAVVALLAAGLRGRAQRLADRWLFGARNDPYAVVTRVGVAAESGADEVVAAMVTVLRDSLALPSVAVMPVTGVPIEVGRPVDTGAEDVPIVVRGQRLGVLRVGHRHRGERFSADETAALRDVAGRVGMVLRTADLAIELRRSRDRVVAGREDERRRLRRELHDGLGPELSGLALQVEALGNRLAKAPELAARAESIRLRLAQTVGEVRRIVDGLRPAALDQLGLAGALRDLAAVDGLLGRIDLTVAVDLPLLDAVVEVTAYRIAAEALANAVAHSGAGSYRLDVAVVDDELRVEVADDGRGFGADIVAGVGLASMYDRAAEAGGNLIVQSDPGCGTVIRARLPLER